MSTRIILIDNHTLFRNGIKTLLSRRGDFGVIDEAADGFTGIRLVGQVRPNIVLLGLDMPVMNDRKTLAQVLSSSPQRTVVMLTVSEDDDDLTECIRIGARGFLLKNVNADFLLDSVRRAVNGDNVFSPKMTTRLAQSLISPVSLCTDHLLSILTLREMEILDYLAAGHSNKVVARHLELAESVTKVYVQNILYKLNLSNRIQAAVYTVQYRVPRPEGVQTVDIRRHIDTPPRHTPKSG